MFVVCHQLRSHQSGYQFVISHQSFNADHFGWIFSERNIQRL